ncbi:MAG: flagellar biosynthesis protein FlhF [Clostridiales bacterium]|nr:flagellar biosynthesis protein FlhF [Clostridiales bacterium]
MVIKKFQAETEIDAIMQAKEELGKDAIVMNIKAVKPKGLQKFFRKARVEVTAAVDEENNYNTGEGMLNKMQELQKTLEEVKKREEEEQRAKKQEEVLNSSKNIIKESEETDINSKGIENRLNNLQLMIERQMQIEDKEVTKTEKKKGVKKEESKADACIRLVKEQLLDNEVEEQYANAILEGIRGTLKRDTTIDNVLASIYQKIVLKLGKTKIVEENQEEVKYIYFIGPTGVGKTTTIAKIASNLKIQKRIKVALITSDTYRIAAVEQLRTYANILGVPLKVIYSEEEMKKAKQEYQDYDIVLIDTAGRSHKNVEQTEDIEKLIKVVPEEERDVYLVLSATTKYKDLVKITETYGKFIKYNLIFTKLDETCCVGNILNVKMLTDATLSYLTSGQNVPGDIEKIDAQKIAKQLLGGQ